MGETKTLYCSFCGKSQNEVQQLIAGPNVFICDECTKLCAEIVNESQRKLYLKQISAAPSRPEISEALKHVLGEEACFIQPLTRLVQRQFMAMAELSSSSDAAPKTCHTLLCGPGLLRSTTAKALNRAMATVIDVVDARPLLALESAEAVCDYLAESLMSTAYNYAPGTNGAMVFIDDFDQLFGGAGERSELDRARSEMVQQALVTFFAPGDYATAEGPGKDMPVEKSFLTLICAGVFPELMPANMSDDVGLDHLSKSLNGLELPTYERNCLKGYGFSDELIDLFSMTIPLEGGKPLG